MSEGSYHIPVLLHAAVDGLVLNKSGVFVDVTFGGGGHSKEILSRLRSDATLIAFDQDEEAEKNSISVDAVNHCNINKFSSAIKIFQYRSNFVLTRDFDIH